MLPIQIKINRIRILQVFSSKPSKFTPSANPLKFFKCMFYFLKKIKSYCTNIYDFFIGSGKLIQIPTDLDLLQWQLVNIFFTEKKVAKKDSQQKNKKKTNTNAVFRIRKHYNADPDPQKDLFGSGSKHCTEADRRKRN